MLSSRPDRLAEIASQPYLALAVVLALYTAPKHIVCRGLAPRRSLAVKRNGDCRRAYWLCSHKRPVLLYRKSAAVARGFWIIFCAGHVVRWLASQRRIRTAKSVILRRTNDKRKRKRADGRRKNDLKQPAGAPFGFGKPGALPRGDSRRRAPPVGRKKGTALWRCLDVCRVGIRRNPSANRHRRRRPFRFGSLRRYRRMCCARRSRDRPC